MKAPGTIEPHLIDPEQPPVRAAGPRDSQFPELDNDKGRGNRYWWVWLLVFALVGYGCYQLYVFENARKEVMSKKKGAMRPRVMSVAVSSAHRGDMPVYLQGLGTVTAFNTVTVKTRVDGQLINISFHEGQFVHEGDLLAQIDPRPYEVALEQANGSLAQAKGTLERDQAALRDAEANYQRYQELFRSQIIAKQQLDTQLATADQARGSIAADQAAIAGAQAAINSAKLNLTYTKITAPLSGRIGLRLVDVGNMVHASDANGLAVITQLQPISVLFSLPEEQLPSVLVKLRQGAKLRVEAYDREQTKKLADGTLLTVDNQIDATTGTSRLKAVFPNSDSSLFPNQFVNARLSLDTKKGVLIIPAVAIQRGPTGTFVYLVGDDSTVSVRPVKVGMTQGNDVEIQDGLAPNDRVVVDGAEKLTEGMEVTVHQPGEAPPSGQPSGRRGRRSVE
ncbi:MAG: MdtA/MuxA family multidrug efflux RND transporter periplasmic adaptor subunit [Bryobacteraceae bacterium]